MTTAPSFRHVRLCLDARSPVKNAGDGVVIAVIDSGVNPRHPHITAPLGACARIELDGTVSGDCVDRLGHGTAVCAAIQEKAPAATVLVARVFADSLSTSVLVLERAIDWAAQQGAHLVNMSLGTSRQEHAPVLSKAADRLADAGGVIVSAARSDGKPWWPGSLPSTIGVIADPDCPRHCIDLRKRGGEELVASSPYPRPIPGVPVERNLNGISFAVANATGVLARILADLPDRTSWPDRPPARTGARLLWQHAVRLGHRLCRPIRPPEEQRADG